ASSRAPTGTRLPRMPAWCSSQSLADSPGRTGDSERSPCRTAFRAERAFPAVVLGPLDVRAFREFAAVCRAVVMFSSPGTHRQGTLAARVVSPRPLALDP